MEETIREKVFRAWAQQKTIEYSSRGKTYTGIVRHFDGGDSWMFRDDENHAIRYPFYSEIDHIRFVDEEQVLEPSEVLTPDMIDKMVDKLLVITLTAQNSKKEGVFNEADLDNIVKHAVCLADMITGKEGKV